MLSPEAKLVSNLERAARRLMNPEDAKKARSLCGWYRSKGFLTTKQSALGHHLLSLLNEPKDESYTTEPHFIYLISDGEHVKIGFSKDPRKRMKDMQTSNAKPLRIVRAFEVIGKSAAKAHERTLHSKFKAHRLKGEWFDMEVMDEALEHFDHHIQMMRDMQADIEVLKEVGAFDELNLAQATI